jgi:4,4'-diapophytoene synthase
MDKKMAIPGHFELWEDVDEQQILQEVSRSFALTIPQLPPDLRKTVTNAYLLCRIIDTIEDEETLSHAEKGAFLQEFNRVLKRKSTAERFAESLYPRLSGRTLPAEKALILSCPGVIRSYFSFDEEKQRAIDRCAAIMSSGMLRFQENRNPCGLKDLTELNAYCYHVAGVVGEMLTDLFCNHSPIIARRRERLYQLAASFGQGLQMTNILKDLWEDKARGACWLPRDVFSEVGFDLQDLSAGNCRPEFGKGLLRLVGISVFHLHNALVYTLLIPRREAGIRKFCLWAIGLAVFTLRNIHRRPGYTSGGQVKVSRACTRGIIGVSNAGLQSNLLLKAFFCMTTRGLPTPGPGFNEVRPSAHEKRPLENWEDRGPG